jgi:hypothetical protein
MTAPVDGAAPRRKKPWKRHLLIFFVSVSVGLTGGTTFLVRFAPPFVLSSAHKAISSGFGSGVRIPDNTLYTVPYLASPETAHGNNWVLGGNQDGLYTVGWLDLAKGPDLLTIPEMGSRYHNVELVAPLTGVAIANLKSAGTTFITARGDATPAPGGTSALHAPGKQLLVIGRTLVYSDTDLPAALALAQQIIVKPYEGR